jgi:hypothetical protein
MVFGASNSFDTSVATGCDSSLSTVFSVLLHVIKKTDAAKMKIKL